MFKKVLLGLGFVGFILGAYFNKDVPQIMGVVYMAGYFVLRGIEEMLDEMEEDECDY